MAGKFPPPFLLLLPKSGGKFHPSKTLHPFLADSPEQLLVQMHNQGFSTCVVRLQAEKAGLHSTSASRTWHRASSGLERCRQMCKITHPLPAQPFALPLAQRPSVNPNVSSGLLSTQVWKSCPKPAHISLSPFLTWAPCLQQSLPAKLGSSLGLAHPGGPLPPPNLGH